MGTLILLALLYVLSGILFGYNLNRSNDGWAWIWFVGGIVSLVWSFFICFLVVDHTQTQIYKPNEYSYMIIDNQRAIVYLKSTHEVLQFTDSAIVNELSDSSSFVDKTDCTIIGNIVAEAYSILRYKNRTRTRN